MTLGLWVNASGKRLLPMLQLLTIASYHFSTLDQRNSRVHILASLNNVVIGNGGSIFLCNTVTPKIKGIQRVIYHDIPLSFILQGQH